MLIKVRVFPNSKKEKIICIAPDIFNIYVRAKPQNGMANEQVINLLVNYLKYLVRKCVLSKVLIYPIKF